MHFRSTVPQRPSYRTLSCEQPVLLDPATGETVGIAYKAKVELTVASAHGSIVEVGSQPVAAWNVTDVVMNRRKQVLPLDMVDNSISPLRTHFGLIFSSFECRRGYFILRVTRLDLFSPSPSLLQLFHRASSHFIHAHMVRHGTGGKR